MALALATDSGGIVLQLLGQRSVPLPTLNDVCDDKKAADQIPVFQALTPAQKRDPKNRKHMVHYLKCKPCRDALGWGDL